MDNLEVSRIFHEIADLLEIRGVRFKPQAYRRAAQTIETLTENLREIYEKGNLEEIPGVGSSIASKIRELLETGGLEYLEDLREELPQGLREIVDIEGIGPKTALKLHRELGISTVGELESAVRAGNLRVLKGFGERMEENILKGIEMYRNSHERFLLGYSLPLAVKVKEQLKKCKAVHRISLAGSIRRQKETIGDIDILVASEDPSKVMDCFASLPQVKRVIAKGKTKSTVLLANNLQVDVRVVKNESFGSALQYFTGSKQHNIRLRDLALKKGWKLSEYSLLDKKANIVIAGKDEKDIYNSLGLRYVPPELREDRGEVEAALENSLPRLIELQDVKGDLHVHTIWSDGLHSIEEMAEEARNLGLEYIAICDHSETLKIAGGLKESELMKQISEIRKANDGMEDFTVLSGAEVNIKSDGTLDVRNQVLKDLDIVVASVHSGFRQPIEEMSKRLLKTIHNNYVNIIGHPTGRILNKRKPIEFDYSRIFEAAADQKVLMEINAFPNRLDLSDVHCQKARDYGVKMTIGTDAHNRDQLRYLTLGVATARRGWLEPHEVVNTLKTKELRSALNK